MHFVYVCLYSTIFFNLSFTYFKAINIQLSMHLNCVNYIVKLCDDSSIVLLCMCIKINRFFFFKFKFCCINLIQFHAVYLWYLNFKKFIFSNDKIFFFFSSYKKKFLSVTFPGGRENVVFKVLLKKNKRKV